MPKVGSLQTHGSHATLRTTYAFLDYSKLQWGNSPDYCSTSRLGATSNRYRMYGAVPDLLAGVRCDLVVVTEPTQYPRGKASATAVVRLSVSSLSPFCLFMVCLVSAFKLRDSPLVGNREGTVVRI